MSMHPSTDTIALPEPIRGTGNRTSFTCPGHCDRQLSVSIPWGDSLTGVWVNPHGQHFGLCQPQVQRVAMETKDKEAD